jgi:hypothetical protein
MTSINPQLSAGKPRLPQPRGPLQTEGEGTGPRATPGDAPGRLLKSFLLTIKPPLGELRMSRLLKAVPLALALAALSVCAASCGSSVPAQIRFVHAIQDVYAIQDAGPLDITVTGSDTHSALEFTNIGFRGVQPNQPGYSSVPSGGDTIQGFLTGTTTNPVFSNSLSLGGGAQYTLIATGFQKDKNGNNAVDLLQISDNIPTPPSGDVEFRVIHASPSGPGTVDVYIELNPNNGPGLPITIQGLTYMQASNYVSFVLNPNNATTPPGFTVYVTASGSMQPIFPKGYPINPSSAGAVRTLVLTDVQDGTMMNSSFLELSDVN